MRGHSRIKDHGIEQRMFVQRAVLGGVGVVALSIFVLARLWDLQVVQHEHFADLSHGNRVRIEPLPPTRGLIYDRNGVVLAENLPAYQLEIIPEETPNIARTLAELTELGLVDPEDLERIQDQIRRQRRFKATTLTYRMDPEQVARFAVQRQHFPGVDVRARLIRHYPQGATAVHALGYVGSISQQDVAQLDAADYAGTTQMGKLGVERRYENDLHGQVGHRQLLVNASGRAIQPLERTAPSPGSDLRLTLDHRLQAAAQAALGDRRGAIVALDPRDGQVLALVSQPAYDPNLFSTGISRTDYLALQQDPDKPLFNRALHGHYPPGSTIKPILGLAGLEYDAVTSSEEIFCRGFYTLPGRDHRYRDWKREGHGHVNLNEAVAQSCDVYYYELALRLGIDRMHEFMASFGFGTPTGIDIPGEKPGLMPSRDWKRRAFSRREDQVWFPGETLITGIGQGYMLTTPMQLASSAATLGMRGQRFQPHLIAEVVDPVTGETELVLPRELEPVKISNDDYWTQAIQSMVDVMHGPTGTARATGQTASYTIAGKTGTAQVFSVAQEEEYDEEEVEERLRDHALFVAVAPAWEPRIAVAVIVENGGSGSGVAAPIAREVMDAWLVEIGG